MRRTLSSRAIGRRDRLTRGLGSLPDSRAPAGLLEQHDICDLGAPLNFLDHVVDRQRGERGGRESFHLHPGGPVVRASAITRISPAAASTEPSTPTNDTANHDNHDNHDDSNGSTYTHNHHHLYNDDASTCRRHYGDDVNDRHDDAISRAVAASRRRRRGQLPSRCWCRRPRLSVSDSDPLPRPV